MQLAAGELFFQRRIHGALLLHPVHAFERSVDHFGGEMLTVISLNDDLGVWEACADQVFDIGGVMAM